MKILRDAVSLTMWTAALAAAIWLGWWAYQQYQSGDAADRPPEVPDIDKECWVVPDTGQCFCQHRWSGERLSVRYEECVALARRP